MNEIYQIYDKAFKRILTLSEKTVINLINGLFDTNYPTDSKITYNWTEHENKDLKRTLADSILTINGRDSYHIEAQMTEDEEIENLRTEENLEELQNFVMNDIIESIYENETVGNISHSDALDLIELTTKLYMKIYSKYKELEEFTMRMCDQSLELISDKYEKTVEELQDEVADMKAENEQLKTMINELKQQLDLLQNNK